MKPVFSIIIPLYNKEKDIENTLNSVMHQSYKDFEVVVVNDGSTDNSTSVVRSFKDLRIKLFETGNNGVSKCRNIAVKHSIGKYIAFLDADDYWYPNHLEELYKMINTFPDGKWFAGAYELQHNKKLVIPMKSPAMKFGKHWIGEIEDFFGNSMIDCMAWTSAVCMMKSFFFELGCFNEEYDTGEDIDLWIRAALKSNLIFSNQVTSRYILTASNRLTIKPTHEKRHMKLEIFKTYEELNISLKKYLDLIRYSYVLKFKLSGQKEFYRESKIDISSCNLSMYQMILLSLPKFLLVVLYKLKNVLIYYNIRVRVPRIG